MKTNKIVLFSIGLLVGLVLGCYLFWPNLFGHKLPWDDISYLIELGSSHTDYEMIILPWIQKTILFGLSGGVVGAVASFGFSENKNLKRVIKNE